MLSLTSSPADTAQALGALRPIRRRPTPSLSLIPRPQRLRHRLLVLLAADRGVSRYRWSTQARPSADSESGTLWTPSPSHWRAEPIASGGDTPAPSLAIITPSSPSVLEGPRLFLRHPPAPRLGPRYGRVLVPMLQRNPFRKAQAVVPAAPSSMRAHDSSSIFRPASICRLPRDAQAGIYRNCSRLIAVNRPADEDDPTITPAHRAPAFSPHTFLLEEAFAYQEEEHGEEEGAPDFALQGLGGGAVVLEEDGVQGGEKLAGGVGGDAVGVVLVGGAVDGDEAGAVAVNAGLGADIAGDGANRGWSSRTGFSMREASPASRKEPAAKRLAPSWRMRWSMGTRTRPSSSVDQSGRGRVAQK